MERPVLVCNLAWLQAGEGVAGIGGSGATASPVLGWGAQRADEGPSLPLTHTLRSSNRPGLAVLPGGGSGGHQRWETLATAGCRLGSLQVTLRQPPAPRPDLPGWGRATVAAGEAVCGVT